MLLGPYMARLSLCVWRPSLPTSPPARPHRAPLSFANQPTPVLRPQVPAGKSMDEFDVVIPKPGQTANLTCVTITSDFIITGSK